jgi:small-conductance mechanosensitive channel
MSGPFVSFTGPDHTVQIAGVKLLGVNASSAHKLLFTLVFFLILYLLSKILRFIAQKAGGARQKTAFWTKQAISLITVLLALVGFVSIWFDNPAKLATGVGLIGAGLAFALRQVITSFAGYFVILRGKTFNVGDRIVMGNVRGDVIALNFIQTVIMEMVSLRRSKPMIPVCGCAAGSTLAASSQSLIRKSLESPFITILATFHTFGRRCICPSPIKMTVIAPNKLF